MLNVQCDFCKNLILIGQHYYKVTINEEVLSEDTYDQFVKRVRELDACQRCFEGLTIETSRSTTKVDIIQKRGAIRWKL